jgi:hypothetical protein
MGEKSPEFGPESRPEKKPRERPDTAKALGQLAVKQTVKKS